MIDTAWLAYLAIPTIWTVFFSMFDTPGIRGWRNLGWPTCYILGFAMLWSLGWRRAGPTWLAVGLAAGCFYFLYQAWTARRASNAAARAQLRTILRGAVAWPIMLPEVIEYTLADIGVLKAGTPTDVERNGEDGHSGA